MPSSVADAACVPGEPLASAAAAGQSPQQGGRLDGFHTAINLLMRRRFSTGKPHYFLRGLADIEQSERQSLPLCTAKQAEYLALYSQCWLGHVVLIWQHSRTHGQGKLVALFAVFLNDKTCHPTSCVHGFAVNASSNDESATEPSAI